MYTILLFTGLHFGLSFENGFAMNREDSRWIDGLPSDSLSLTRHLMFFSLRPDLLFLASLYMPSHINLTI